MCAMFHDPLSYVAFSAVCAVAHARARIYTRRTIRRARRVFRRHGNAAGARSEDEPVLIIISDRVFVKMIIVNFGIRNQIVTIFRAREPGMCIAFNKKLLYFTIKRKTILQKTRFYAIL